MFCPYFICPTDLNSFNPGEVCCTLFLSLILYLYRNYTGGPGTTVQRLFNVTSKMMNGEKISRADVPVARRFFGETYARTFELRTGDQQLIDNIDKQENTSRAKASRIASGYKTQIQNADSPQERSRILQDMLIDCNRILLKPTASSILQ